MNWQHIGSLALFSSYFIAIIGLFSLITSTLYRTWKTSLNNAIRVNPAVFIGLTVGSLTHTWFYMFRFMEWSFANYEYSLQSPPYQDLVTRIASWLYDTSLFEQAWAMVCRHPLSWWWSEQLCLFTAGAWTVFVASEGSRYNIKHLWAYMLLGQIVAISVASNLFYLALILSPSFSDRKVRESKELASPTLWMNVLLSLASVANVPFTSQKTFLTNLLVMHVLLFVPLLSSEPKPAPKSITVKNLYRIVHLVSAFIHARTVMNAAGFLRASTHPDASNVAKVAWTVLHSNPAQSSIGWDVIWTSLSFVVWTLVKPVDAPNSSKLFSIPYLLLATPLASIGITAPYVLQPKPEPPVLEPATDKTSTDSAKSQQPLTTEAKAKED